MQPTIERKLSLNRWRMQDAPPTVAADPPAIVADMPHDPRRPVPGQAELLAERVLGTDQTLDIRLCGAQSSIDVCRRDAELFRRDHGEMRPLDDELPRIVALADCRCKRLLGDELRKDDMIRHGRELCTFGVELRAVGGQDRAAP